MILFVFLIITCIVELVFEEVIQSLKCKNYKVTGNISPKSGNLGLAFPNALFDVTTLQHFIVRSLKEMTEIYREPFQNARNLITRHFMSKKLFIWRIKK